MMEALKSKASRLENSSKSAWSGLINEFSEMGAEVGPGPWAGHGNEDNDHSVIVKYANDQYGTFLIWLVDRVAGTKGHKRHEVWSSSWLIPVGSRNGERGLADENRNQFDPSITATEMIERLQVIADTDPYTGKNVGWQNMHRVGFANFASDESIDRARRELEYTGWCD